MFKVFKSKVLVIKIWKWNKFQIELCLFRPCCVIEAHKHDDENIELFHVFGKAHYYRYSSHLNVRKYTTKWYTTMRFFTIPAGYWHGANIGWTGLITLSCQHWLKEPSSVTSDYIEANI